MTASKERFFSTIWRNVRNSAAAWIATMIASLVSTIVVSTWAYLRQLTLPEIIWYTALTLPISITCFGWCAVTGRRVWSALSGQIEIRFDPQSNLSNEEARIVVSNLSHSKPLKNLQVKIESLIPQINANQLRNKAMQFTGLPLKIERGQQKMELAAAEHAEVWVARHPPGKDSIQIYSSDSSPYSESGSFYCDVGEYLLTVIATGENVPPARRSFLLSAHKDHGIVFSPKPTRSAQR